MQFTSEKATFFQCGFHFYIGDIDDKSTIIFKEDYIIIGNINTVKNIFAMGELIVIGNINSKSIYVSKDFLCLGNIDTELIDVEGKSKVISNEELKNEISLDITDEIIQKHKIEVKREEYSKDDIENECNDKNDDNAVSCLQNIISNRNEEEVVLESINELEKLSKLYEIYINKKGDIVFGKVLRIEENKYIVKLNNIEGKLLKDKGRNFKIGDIIGAYIQTIRYEDSNLEIFLEENDRFYITKIIKLEMRKNKYDFDKVFIKKINKESEDKYIVDIYSEQHTKETLYIIENKLKNYSNGREIKLRIYKGKNNISKDIEVEINKNLDELFDDKNRNTNKYKSINDFYLYDIIYHKKFGKGKIISIVDKEIAKIEFNGIIKDLNVIYLINNKLISKEDIYSE